MADLIDSAAGLGRLQGNKGLYKRMLNLYIQSKEPEAFEQALADNDTDRASAVMHSIKGVAGNLALTALFDISSELMIQLRDGIADPELIGQYREILKATNGAAEALAAELA